jgi:hypothetical protein
MDYFITNFKSRIKRFSWVINLVHIFMALF